MTEIARPPSWSRRKGDFIGTRFFRFGEGVCGKELYMRVKSEDALEIIRRELQTMMKRGGKITERDLLRLSAQTGIDYSTVLRIQQELS